METPTKLEALAEMLVVPDRQFAPRTPHTYAHTGQTVLRAIGEEYPDLPDVRAIYRKPEVLANQGGAE